MKKTVIIAILCFFVHIFGYSQIISNEKLGMIQLPPLDSLFESARLNNSRTLAQDAKVEVAIRQLRSERHNWWNYFRGFASYQYGIMASLVDITSGGVPITPQYSQQAQSWWNIGFGVSVPLNDIIDRSNRISQEKAKLRIAQYDAEIQFDELKIEIAQAYSATILALNVSYSLSDKYNFLKAQYEICEKDFIAGKISSSELSNAKSQEVDAYINFQRELSNLIHYATILETLTKMPILNK